MKAKYVILLIGLFVFTHETYGVVGRRGARRVAGVRPVVGRPVARRVAARHVGARRAVGVRWGRPYGRRVAVYRYVRPVRYYDCDCYSCGCNSYYTCGCNSCGYQLV